MKKILSTGVLMLALSGWAHAEYTADAVAGVATNTASVGTYIASMTPTEAAKFVCEVVGKITANPALDEVAKKRALADLVARVVILSGPNASQVMSELFACIAPNGVAQPGMAGFVPAIVAAAVVAAGDQADGVWGAIQTQLKGNDLAGAEAAKNDPASALPEGVERAIRQIGAAGSGPAGAPPPALAQPGSQGGADEEVIPPPPPPPPDTY